MWLKRKRGRSFAGPEGTPIEGRGGWTMIEFATVRDKIATAVSTILSGPVQRLAVVTGDVAPPSETHTMLSWPSRLT